MSWAGDLIKSTRKECGMTQEELSYMLEIPKRTIEEWERGARTPATYLAKLIKYRLTNNE